MKSKKGLMLAGLVALAALTVFISAAPFSGADPITMIQGAYYNPAYACIYMKGSDELFGAETQTPNEWHTYELALTRDNIGYDGMSGNYKNITLLRIKAGATSANKDLAVYIDNVRMINADGETIFSWDFNDGDLHGPYTSQGNPQDGNNTIQTLDGEKCFLMHAKSQTLYGYSGVEVQWELPESPDTRNGKWDLKSNEYTLIFDYFIAQ